MKLDTVGNINSQAHEIVVESKVSVFRYLADLWKYRELFLFISARDILLRYRQAFFGIAWALVRPLLVLVFFSQVFSQAHFTNSGHSYFLVVLSAAPVWIFFSGSVQDSIVSLVKNSELISKVYFPRLLLIGSAISANLVDFIIGLGLALVCALFLGKVEFPNILFLPLIILAMFVCVLGWSLLAAAMNARYRDLTNIAPFLIQLLLIASPVGYVLADESVFSNPFYYLNPLVGIIEAMRYCILGGHSVTILWGLFFSFLQSVAVLSLGFRYFRKIEDALADVI
jgi:lipopolysaccharide transport system permease protein